SWFVCCASPILSLPLWRNCRQFRKTRWRASLKCVIPAAMTNLSRTVALVGMMGAGKSSVGRTLANRLGVEVRDADSEIEQAAGCPVPEIFERFGEQAFRDGERKVIARLLGAAPHVLATGGGAFIDPSTRARIKESAVSVWIKAPVDVLMSRVKRRDDRPLL